MQIAMALLSRSLLMTTVAACALSAIVAYLTRDNPERDEAYYQTLPVVPLGKEFHRSGTVKVTHSDSTLQKVADAQGPSPRESVDIAYHSSYAPEKEECDAKKHIMLLHGTGFNKDAFHWTEESLRTAGNDGMASALSPQLKDHSIVSRLHTEPGVCVTTIDLRGHGASSGTVGPWSVRLLAADVAEALKLIHGDDVKVHAYGHSVGFGSVMSIGFNYPELVWSIIGSGFLSDMGTANSWLGYIFSRKPVINALGMERLGSAGADAISVSTSKPYLKEMLGFVKLPTYLYTSQSWLNYNEGNKLSMMKAPVLWMLPIKDDLCGYTVERVEQEFQQLPASNGNKMIMYNKTGEEDHCFPFHDPDLYFGDLLHFIKSKT